MKDSGSNTKVLAEHISRQNKIAVLNLIRQEGEISRVEFSPNFGWRKVDVSAKISETLKYVNQTVLTLFNLLLTQSINYEKMLSF